jgi:hypothetical protein
MIKIKNFPKNSRLTFLGSIFKDIKNSEWNITVGLENDKYSTKDQRYILNRRYLLLTLRILRSW